MGDNIGKAFDDSFLNNTSDNLMIRRSNGLWAGPVSLQTSVTVIQTSDYKVSYNADFPWIKDGTDDVYIFRK